MLTNKDLVKATEKGYDRNVVCFDTDAKPDELTVRVFALMHSVAKLSFDFDVTNYYVLKSDAISNCQTEKELLEEDFANLYIYNLVKDSIIELDDEAYKLIQDTFNELKGTLPMRDSMLVLGHDSKFGNCILGSY